MPTDAHIRTDLLGPEIATPVVWLLAIVLMAAWIGAHAFRHKLPKSLKLPFLGGSVILGMVALWALYQAVSRHLVLESTWPLWTNSFVGALAIEFAILVYQLEKQLVSSRLGKLLLGVRIGAIGVILTVLVQPVFARDSTRTIERKVVVLVDDSGSMQIADPQMTVAEKVQLASFYGVEALKNRPALESSFAVFSTALSQIDKALAELSLQENFSTDADNSATAQRKEALVKLIADSRKASADLRAALKLPQNLPDDARRSINDIERALGETFSDRLQDAEKRTGESKFPEVSSQLKLAREAGQKVMDRSPFLIEAADKVFYDSAPQDVKKSMDDLSAKTRATLARDTMERQRPDLGNKTLTELLREKYGLQIVRFGKKSTEAPDYNFPEDGKENEFRLLTNVTSALTKISESYEAENLAGVLLLSDARHNADVPTDDVARKLGIQGSPIVPVLIGSTKGSKDASIISVGAAQSIFEGDRIRTKIEVKADGLRGKTLKVRLLQDGAEVATQEVTVPDDIYRTTVRLGYQPKTAGIFSHTVKVDPIEGELFDNNNQWTFQTAVSDDRTNVLLVDDRPRWEFRYLRNLFDSRDKSVHLQYVLLHPDTLEGAPTTEKLASASAKFGDSEATRLPQKAEDWKKFDVIILGDIPPASLGQETWEIIRQCVEDRGALLTLIAGPESMPHAYTNETFQKLCPVLYQQNTAPIWEGPEEAYRLMLTAEGRNNLIFQQSLSGLENARIWESMPLLRWRHPILGVKETANVLAYASPATLDAAGNEIPQSAFQVSWDPAALTRQKETEKKNALVVTSQAGSGKVAMLSFDHTWRFRYGVGDTYHHRFWGQLLRWGAGENLRAGTELVRLGTDKLTYAPGDSIKIMGRMIEKDYRPVTDSSVTATILKGNETVARRSLAFQADSPGMYEGLLDSITEPGDYTLELSGNDVARLGEGKAITTKFTVASASNPIEFGDLSTDREQAIRLATLSNGQVATPATVTQALEKFGPASTQKTERRETKLWDNWIIMASMLGLLTTEWIARRRGGLV